MIVVASPDKPFSYTAKGTARRKAIINDYESEIDQLYDEVDRLAETDVTVIEDWSHNAILQFVRKIVSEILEKVLGDGDEFFQHGCDRSVFVAGHDYVY